MITIVSGTNRSNSLTLEIAHLYRRLLADRSVDSTIVDLSKLPHDFVFSALYENNGKDEQFNELRRMVEHARKLVFIIPEYNGSFPGVLKAFVDGLGYPNSLNNKKAAMVGLSAGVQGGVLAMSHLADIFNYMGMNTLALRVKLPAIEKNFTDGKITNALYNQLLEMQADQLIAF